MLYDIVIDWLYLLLSAFAICVCLYVAHFVLFELNHLFSFVLQCVGLIETYFWTSVFCVCLLGLLTFDIMQKQRRQRHSLGRDYFSDADSTRGLRPSALNVCQGQSVTSKLRQKNESVVSRAVNSLSIVGEALGLCNSQETKSINRTLSLHKSLNLEVLKARCHRNEELALERTRDESDGQ